MALFGFQHHLTAGTAGRNGSLQESVLVSGCDGKHLHRLVGVLRTGIKQNGPFGTESRRIGSVLLITSGENHSVFQPYGSPYGKVRVGRIAPAGCFFSFFYQLAVFWGEFFKAE